MQAHYSELWIRFSYSLTLLACLLRNKHTYLHVIKMSSINVLYYYSGPIGERMNLRYFLSFGMMVSGFFGFLFGLAYWTEIHSLSYFLVIQIVAGFFQSTGWPGNVAVVGNWFGKSKRGF